ncbi:MAG: hypothetical protein G3M78_07370 [Candidatus Nitrohelix vancouverensis]|uniref:dTDP-4-dehydrorhamnose 3,5-epimerase n=1 Tax=Candidatus Nitrohelix vancouverensis TaxID=2705534 RepID=A0A7T0C2C8_9BACT|nr:MAG: hypothetical protein G3M78_07370 [Candidatus Nitrohelix vancouverensis]
MKKYKISDLDKKSDHRGWLIEALGADDLEAPASFGQIHVSVAYPGKVRGNHYHTRKVEWFCVPTGVGELLLHDLETGEEERVVMGADHLKTVKILPGVVHAIKNTGDTDMALIVYSNEVFDPEDPDTFYQEILK